MGACPEMRRIDEFKAAQVSAPIDKLRPIGDRVAVHSGIDVYRAPSALIGVKKGETVFFVEFRCVELKVNGKKVLANRVLRAWRDFSVKKTKDFLLPLFVPFILAPTGLALSAGTYTPRAEALSKKIVALVPFAYAWDNGKLSKLVEWERAEQILFSMDEL